MNIIIAGAGRVGFRLARTLSPKNNVVIMDQNEEALSKLSDSIDALTICANIENPRGYEGLKGKAYDFFIAVTDTDEINLIGSLIVDEKINVKRKIIRLKNQFFATSSIASKIGITDAVFPFSMVGQSVKSLIQYPCASNVKGLKNITCKLISAKATVPEGESLPMETFASNSVKIVGIDRQKKFFIPDSRDKIENNDTVYFFGEPEAINQFTPYLNPSYCKKIKYVVIFGAHTLGIEIAKALIECNMRIKIIEKDIHLCMYASQLLQDNVTVINSKYGDFRLFEEEGLGSADMIIAATPNDNENIVKCVEARELGVNRVVAINNDIEHYQLMHTLGIIALRGPKMNAFYAIMEIINSNKKVEERLFCGGAAICLMQKFDIGSPVPKLNNQVDMFSFYLQGSSIILDSDHLNPQVSFSVIIFTARKNEEGARKWINML
jgi:trk system potassium uptake protein TrkA